LRSKAASRSSNVVIFCLLGSGTRADFNIASMMANQRYTAFETHGSCGSFAVTALRVVSWGGIG
jgi:hypothetical protein